MRMLVFLAVAFLAMAIPSEAITHPAKAANIHSSVLYDPARGTTPDAQGWSLLAIGGTETPPGKSGATTFSTLTDPSIQGGYFLLSQRLDRQKGYDVRFSLQVAQESHAGPNRAGISLIVIGNDGIGLELEFWDDQVWAQSDHPLFVHAEGAAFDTHGSGDGGLVHYLLAIHGSRYELSANGHALLAGPLRDYRSFQGPISPYQTPNLIFLGDDSKSASGKLRVGKILLETTDHGG